MYLLINMSQKDQIDLSLFTENEKTDYQVLGRNKELLGAIDQLLQQTETPKEDIQGIMVVVGAGGFTSTRLAVTVANTFGSVLQIPLMTITQDQVGDIQSLIPQLQEQPKGQLISATYSGEPNIGG